MSKDLILHPFILTLNEMQENIFLVSYSSRIAYEFWTEMRNDFLPYLILCNTTQRFVRAPKVPLVPVGGGNRVGRIRFGFGHSGYESFGFQVMLADRVRSG